MYRIRAIYLALVSRGFFMLSDAGSVSSFKDSPDTWAAVIASAERFLEWCEEKEAEAIDREV